MPRRRERAQYQASECIRTGLNGCLHEAGLSYRDIAARTGHAAMTVIRVWNQCNGEKRIVRSPTSSSA